MKPDTATAMKQLIQDARAQIPFDLPLDCSCDGHCEECPSKLVEFLYIDLSNWEFRLKRGDVPSVGELHTLGRECLEVRNLLRKKGFIEGAINK